MLLPTIQFYTTTHCTDQYEYRGEGNAHLALSLQNTKKIILIKKQAHQEQTNHTVYEDSIDFYNKIMKVLMQPFAFNVEKVKLCKNQLEQIECNILSQRPTFRLDKSLSHMCVALIHDYTRCDFPNDVENIATISFEIKPKCPINIDGKCKFCWKQSQKLIAGRIQNKTSYCPKKLYSGDINEIQKAIDALLENPQNNMQIYKNSNLIYCQNKKIKDIFKQLTCWESSSIRGTISQLLSTILMYEYDTYDQCASCENSKFTVLDRLLQLQGLDSSNKAPLTDERGYVNLLLLQLKTDTVDDEVICERCKIMSFLNRPLIKHYISKIARDCSIMINVKQIPKNMIHSLKGFHMVEVDEIDYIFNVKVLDLFPKEEK